MTSGPGLRIGYKASAEQFAPGELGAYAVRAEELLSLIHISEPTRPY